MKKIDYIRRTFVVDKKLSKAFMSMVKLNGKTYREVVEDLMKRYIQEAK